MACLCRRACRPDNNVEEEIVNKLVSLCVTLNEYPHVRYNQNSVLAAGIATKIQDALNVSAPPLPFLPLFPLPHPALSWAPDERRVDAGVGGQVFVSRQEDWWYYGQAGHTDKERATLLILERSEDPLTPFMHEHTYQVRRQDVCGFRFFR